MTPTLATVMHHPANRTGRDFVVGDLHGCVDALRYLLHEVRFDAVHDRLFSVGDLVDRGEQSREALELLDRPWFFPVLGNHEEALCGVAEGRVARASWCRLGGGWADELPQAALEQHAQRLRQLPLARVVGAGEKRFNILHAEFFSSDAELDTGQFDETVRERMLWGRELALGAIDPPHRGLSLTYCGHTPMREVAQVGSQIFIDTGAFLPEGRLTMVEALTSRCWSISTREARERGAAQIPLP